MIHIKTLNHPQLNITDWRISAGDAWCVIGRNGSGKQLIDQLLTDQLGNVDSGAVLRDVEIQQIRLISFEQQQLIYERELRLAANDLLGDEDTATRAADFLPSETTNSTLIDDLDMRHRLNTRYTQLSTGESRKLLVLQALLEGVSLLILDNPFDSLDQRTCHVLSETLQKANSAGITVMFLLSNRQDIPQWCNLMAAVDEGRLDTLNHLDQKARESRIQEVLQLNDKAQPNWPDTALGLSDYPHKHLVALNSCTVRFGSNVILDQITLNVAPLQHTLITGENGSGKSTLLGLITGDCPQCFSNDVNVLGYQRGNGESVWDIKKHMGIVSNDLHRRYRVHCDVETVVCSGFFDSIGVYDSISDQQRLIASQWLTAAGLGEQSRHRFQEISYGEQRLVLIARALVKSPLLLVLDEPTQGLDELNRGRLLDLLEVLNQRRHSTVLFVSHRVDEHLPLFAQHYHLDSRNGH